MKRLLIALCLIAFLFFSIQAVRAAESASYSLDWWTVDSGGGTSQAGTYSLSGTVGQTEPGALHGGVYSLVGGFWANLQAALEKLFLPLVLRE
jgi:hypothetical protein